jgi:hypothetical protein
MSKAVVSFAAVNQGSVATNRTGQAARFVPSSAIGLTAGFSADVSSKAKAC